MYLYAVFCGESNYDFTTEYTIVSVHQTVAGAVKKWEEVKRRAEKCYGRINPHYFVVRKIKVED